MKRILITGKNSYVGTSVKTYLEQWPKKYHVEELDVKGEKWKRVDFSKFDVVFHVAGLAHRKISEKDEKQTNLYYKVNTELTEEVAKKCKKDGVSQFIFMSTASVYGDGAPIGKERIITSKTPLSPTNTYGDSKLQAERLISKLEDKDFKIVIVRPPMIYGKGCKGNYQSLRSLALKLPFFPKIKNERSMIYIDNFSSFIKRIIDNDDNGVFHPSNSKPVNTTEMAKQIAEANGKKIRTVSHLTFALKASSLLIGKINKAFGNFCYDQSIIKYKDNYEVVSFKDGIKATEK